jgi:hypothetical protein
MQTIHDLLGLLGVFGLLGQSVVEEDVAGLLLDVGNAVTRGVTHLDQVGVVLLGKVLNQITGLVVQAGILNEIDFGQNDHQGLVLEERLDVLEQGDLLLNGVATGLRDIDEVQDASIQVSKGCD